MITHKALPPIALIAAAGLLLSACGSSTDDDSAEQPEVKAVVETPDVMEDGKLTVCTSFDNPPNNFYTEDHKQTGVETEFARAIGPLMSLETQFVETKFASLIPALQATQCDAIMASLYIKPEREEVVDFVPYMLSGQAVVVSADNPKAITGYDDSLCGKKVGYQVSTTAEEYVVKQVKKCEESGKGGITTVKTEDGTLGMQQVQTGQVDAFVDTQTASIYNAGKTDGQLKVIGKPFGSIKIGAAVQKGNDQLSDAFSAAFDELVKSGKYTEILDQFDSAEMALE